jgi:hypothetical protein
MAVAAEGFGGACACAYIKRGCRGRRAPAAYNKEKELDVVLTDVERRRELDVVLTDVDQT